MAFFLVLLSVAALREQITRLLKVFWQVLGKLKGHYFNSQEVDGSKFFQNKGYLPGEKKGFFFSYYWMWQTLSNKSSGSTMHSGKFCASCEIKSLGPKRSIETTFQKTAILRERRKKAYLVLKYQVRQIPCNLLWGCTKCLPIVCAKYKMLYVTRGRLLKTQKFENNVILQVNDFFGPLFLVLPNMTNVKEQFWSVQVFIWQLVCKL